MPRTPTPKQIKTLQLISQGYSTHRAMKEAGYSKATVSKSANFKKSPVVQRMMKDLGAKLYEKGYTTDFLADKFMEWLNAKKLHTSHTEPDREVPDYDIQIKAYKESRELFKEHESNKIKRKLTIEEFIEGSEDEPR